MFANIEFMLATIEFMLANIKFMFVVILNVNWTNNLNHVLIKIDVIVA